MKKLKSYISLLLLALLLLPIADKAAHDFEHLTDFHCAIKDVHYCKTEHTCPICDYVFSSSATPPHTQEQLSVFSTKTNEVKPLLVFNTKLSPRFKLSLRGPPLS